MYVKRVPNNVYFPLTKKPPHQTTHAHDKEYTDPTTKQHPNPKKTNTKSHKTPQNSPHGPTHTETYGLRYEPTPNVLS